MTYTTQQVANYFLGRAEAESMPMTQLKLIKLVFLAYGWYIAVMKSKLFNEQIEAWQHGPVVPSIYHEFKDFRSDPISRKAMDLDLDTWDFTTPEISETDNETILVLDRVWGVYKNFSGWDLRERTHKNGTPWHQVYKQGERGIKIKDSDVQAYFEKEIRGYLDAAKAARQSAS